MAYVKKPVPKEYFWLRFEYYHAQRLKDILIMKQENEFMDHLTEKQILKTANHFLTLTEAKVAKNRIWKILKGNYL